MGDADRLADGSAPVPAAHRGRGPRAVPQPRGPADRPGPDLRRGEAGRHRDRRGSCDRARRGDARPLAGGGGLAAPAASAGRADLFGLHRRADAGRGGAARRRGGDLPLGGGRPDQARLSRRAPAPRAGAGAGRRRASAGDGRRRGVLDRPRALSRRAVLRRGRGAAHGEALPLRRPQRRPAALRRAGAPAAARRRRGRRPRRSGSPRTTPAPARSPR